MTDDRPRLLLIGAQPPPQHGVSIINDLLLRSPLLARHFQVRHLDLSDHRPISTVEKFDWENVCAAFSHGAQAVWQMVRWQPDIVYVPISQKTLGYLRDMLFLIPARLLGRKTVVHLHGGNFHVFHRQAPSWLRPLIQFSLARVRRAIILGESLRGCFDGLVASDRVVVVPNGIPGVHGQRGPAAALRVLFLGTLDREKGIEIFLESAREVLARTDQVEFIVAGPWYRDEDRRRLETQANSKRICFLGEVTGTDKTRALLSADVLVFPSIQQEGMPLTVLEAMSAGLAVVASDCGCLREVIVEGETGFLVAPGDGGAIVEKLNRLAADRGLCERLGQAGRNRFGALYRGEVFVERFARVLLQVCDG